MAGVWDNGYACGNETIDHEIPRSARRDFRERVADCCAARSDWDLQRYWIEARAPAIIAGGSDVVKINPGA